MAKRMRIRLARKIIKKQRRYKVGKLIKAVERLSDEYMIIGWTVRVEIPVKEHRPMAVIS